jgi:hypothetical protein
VAFSGTGGRDRLNSSFALRSQVKYSRLESLHRNENKENPSREGERQGQQKREKGKGQNSQQEPIWVNMGQGEKCH